MTQSEPGTDTHPREEAAELWIETRQGGWFFVNAVLAIPELVVLVPLTVGFVFGLLVPNRGPSPFIDTIPFVASKSLPVVGCLLVIPIWTTVQNLRLEKALLPKTVLFFFLVLHLGFFGYTVWTWVG